MKNGNFRVAALAGAALLLAACGSEAPPTAADHAEHALPIAAYEVVPRDLSRTLVLSGALEARQHIRVAARTAGVVERVHVEEGDRVSSGAPLAKLDTAEARAELARAQAQYDAARVDLGRMRQLRERNMVSSAELEAAEIAQRVAAAERQLWRTRVDHGEVRAPADAVVTARLIEPGEAVAAQQALFEIAVDDVLMLRVGASERDAVQIEPGQAVALSVDAQPDNALPATVRRVFPAADRSTRLITIEIAIARDADPHLRPGFLARARLTLGDAEPVLAVPADAIGEDDDGTRYVLRIDNGRLARQDIEAGITRGGWTAVRSGLGANTLILATSPRELTDGQAVRVVGRRG